MVCHVGVSLRHGLNVGYPAHRQALRNIGLEPEVGEAG